MIARVALKMICSIKSKLNIVVNSMQITPITNLMCGASDNQATKTKFMEQL